MEKLIIAKCSKKGFMALAVPLHHCQKKEYIKQK